MGIFISNGKANYRKSDIMI